MKIQTQSQLQFLRDAAEELMWFDEQALAARATDLGTDLAGVLYLQVFSTPLSTCVLFPLSSRRI